MTININLRRKHTNTHDWVLKEWEIYSGKYFLGRIYKRYIGKGTPIVTGGPREKAFQLNILIFTGPTMGLEWFRTGYCKTLKEAKRKVKKAYVEYINELTQ